MSLLIVSEQSLLCKLHSRCLRFHANDGPEIECNHIELVNNGFSTFRHSVLLSLNSNHQLKQQNGMDEVMKSSRYLFMKRRKISGITYYSGTFL